MTESKLGTPSSGASFFNRIVLGAPWLFVLITLSATTFFGYYISQFRMDASTDSIVLENDGDLRYYDVTRELFGSDDFVVITVTPDDDLFSPPTLDILREFVATCESMERDESVTTILTVPLFHSPDVPLMKLADGYRTLASEDVDLELAREEFTSSPLYKDYLISIDGKTTAVQVNFKAPHPEYQKIITERRELRLKKADETLTPEEALRLPEVERAYKIFYAENTQKRIEDIEYVRSVVAEFRPRIGTIHLGGVPMIMADIISYVRSDIVTFGFGVLALVLVVLAIIFRKIKWVLLPTLTCVFTVTIMLGYMGYTDWAATIVTSNFPSLLIVITMAMAIHVVVRYRELYSGNPDMSNRDLVLNTVRLVAKPCLYTSLTTIVGFSSLLVSGIRPVMDFGIMMAVGLSLAYVLCFLFLPTALMFFPKGKRPPAKLAELKQSPMQAFAKITELHGKLVGTTALLLFIFCVIGAQRLEVENRFIDYFRSSTEIYQGMTIIDSRIGGTTPLEIVLEGEGKDFWIKKDKLADLREIHEWLDALPETGKVISPDTMVRLLEKVNENKPVPLAFITLALKMLPEDIQKAVVGPYLSAERDQIRIVMRVRESDRSLRRQELMLKMEDYFENEAPLNDGATAHITGVFVLYNNMLQSLFQSQIVTIGTVFLAIWVMFLVLIRSPLLATIAIIPNILPVVLVLGTLGWAGIPLDIMTIMIAAITLGIAVDFAIHYIHRFQTEFPKDHDYIATMYRCHNSIGRAIFFTTVTIVAGFSILVFSNFNPTVYFGIFTSLAITVAFLASVTLLPLLLITWKPLGKSKTPGQA